MGAGLAIYTGRLSWDALRRWWAETWSATGAGARERQHVGAAWALGIRCSSSAHSSPATAFESESVRLLIARAGRYRRFVATYVSLSICVALLLHGVIPAAKDWRFIGKSHT